MWMPQQMLRRPHPAEEWPPCARGLSRAGRRTVVGCTAAAAAAVAAAATAAAAAAAAATATAAAAAAAAVAAAAAACATGAACATVAPGRGHHRGHRGHRGVECLCHARGWYPPLLAAAARPGASAAYAAHEPPAGEVHIAKLLPVVQHSVAQPAVQFAIRPLAPAELRSTGERALVALAVIQHVTAIREIKAAPLPSACCAGRRGAAVALVLLHVCHACCAQIRQRRLLVR